MTLYEEKYGILSEDFYAALMSGQLARYDEYDETVPILAGGKGYMKHGYDAKQPTLSKCNSVTSLKHYVSNQPIKNG